MPQPRQGSDSGRGDQPGPAFHFQQQGTERVPCRGVRASRRCARRRDRQQGQRPEGGNGGDDALADATAQGHHRKVAVLIARERVKRYGQHQGVSGLEQREHNVHPHNRRVLCDDRELRGSSFGAAGCLAGQDHAGDAGRDVEEKDEAGDSCIRCASHVCSGMQTPFTSGVLTVLDGLRY